MWRWGVIIMSTGAFAAGGSVCAWQADKISKDVDAHSANIESMYLSGYTDSNGQPMSDEMLSLYKKDLKQEYHDNKLGTFEWYVAGATLAFIFMIFAAVFMCIILS